MSMALLIPQTNRLPEYERSRPFVVGMYEGLTPERCAAMVGKNSHTTTVDVYLRMTEPSREVKPQRINSDERRSIRRAGKQAAYLAAHSV